MHLFAASVLLLASIVLVSVSHSSDVSNGLDFVTLYTYKKAVVDRDKALLNLTQSVKDTSFWIRDRADTNHCMNMSDMAYPVLTFASDSNPTSPTCQLRFDLVGGTTTGTVKVSQVVTGSTFGCRPGVYPLLVSGGTGVVPLQPTLSVFMNPSVNQSAPTLNFTVTPDTFGFQFTTFGAQWAQCRDLRQQLAQQYLGNTSCEGGTSSQMCTCVRAFTDRLTDWSARLKYQPAPDLYLEDVLLNGVSRCLDLRRAHDVRTAVSGDVPRSRYLLTFSLSMFINAVYRLFVAVFERPEKRNNVRLMVSLICEGVLLVGALLVGVTDSTASNSFEYLTLLAMLLPPVFVLGLYDVLADTLVDYKVDRSGLPFLQPVVFDLCLCSLTLFTLLERGVVQVEYLVAEVFKCHAVGALYAGAAWYHRHLGGEDKAGAFASAYTQQAYAMMSVVALASAFDSVVVPYPSRGELALHWLLPALFTFLGFANCAWGHAMRLSYPAVKVSRFNDLAGFLAVMFGLALFFYALRGHIQVYGAGHFLYATVDSLNLPMYTRSV